MVTKDTFLTTDMDNKQTNYDALEKLAKAEGAALFAVADISNIKSEFIIPSEVLKDINFAVVIGVRLSKAILNTLIDGPNQMYYFHYQRINMLLDMICLKLTEMIQAKGYQALPIPASQITNWKNMKGQVSHKKVAHLAGLGWFGRNNLLVNMQYGSQVRYPTVLSDLPLLPPKSHQNKFSCEKCKKCIPIYPAGAISEDKFDLEKCITKMKQLCKENNIPQLICGLCIKVCD